MFSVALFSDFFSVFESLNSSMLLNNDDNNIVLIEE